MHLLGEELGFKFSEEDIIEKTKKRIEICIEKFNEIKTEWNKEKEQGKKLSEIKETVVGSFTAEQQKRLDELREKIEKNPKSASAYNERGHFYYTLEEYEKAVGDLKEAIKIDPNKAVYYNNRGENYYWLNKYKEAVDDFSKAIEIEPNKAPYYLGRGANYHQLADYEKAVLDFKKAIDLDKPNKADYLARIAESLFLLGKKDEAHSDLKDAMALDDAVPRCYYVRGRIRLTTAKVNNDKCSEEVLKDFDKAIELQELRKNKPGFFVGRAEYHLYRGELKKAHEDLQKSFDIWKDNGYAYFFLAYYYRIKGNEAEFDRYIKKSKEFNHIPVVAPRTKIVYDTQIIYEPQEDPKEKPQEEPKKESQEKPNEIMDIHK